MRLIPVRSAGVANVRLSYQAVSCAVLGEHLLTPNDTTACGPGFALGTRLNITTFRCADYRLPQCMAKFQTFDQTCGSGCNTSRIATNTTCGIKHASCTGTADNATITPNCSVAFANATNVSSEACAAGCMYAKPAFNVFGSANFDRDDVSVMRVGAECFVSAFVSLLGAAGESRGDLLTLNYSAAVRPAGFGAVCGSNAVRRAKGECAADAACIARMEFLLLEAALRCGFRSGGGGYRNCTLLSTLDFAWHGTLPRFSHRGAKPGTALTTRSDMLSLDTCMQTLWSSSHSATTVMADAIACSGVIASMGVAGANTSTSCAAAKLCTNWRAVCGSSAPLVMAMENRSISTETFHCSEQCSAAFTRWYDSCSTTPAAQGIPNITNMVWACSATNLRTWLGGPAPRGGVIEQCPTQSDICPNYVRDTDGSLCSAAETLDQQIIGQFVKQYKHPRCTEVNTWDLIPTNLGGDGYTYGCATRFLDTATVYLHSCCEEPFATAFNTSCKDSLMPNVDIAPPGGSEFRPPGGRDRSPTLRATATTRGTQLDHLFDDEILREAMRLNSPEPEPAPVLPPLPPPPPPVLADDSIWQLSNISFSALKHYGCPLEAPTLAQDPTGNNVAGGWLVGIGTTVAQQVLSSSLCYVARARVHASQTIIFGDLLCSTVAPEMKPASRTIGRKNGAKYNLTKEQCAHACYEHPHCLSFDYAGDNPTLYGDFGDEPFCNPRCTFGTEICRHTCNRDNGECTVADVAAGTGGCTRVTCTNVSAYNSTINPTCEAPHKSECMLNKVAATRPLNQYTGFLRGTQVSPAIERTYYDYYELVNPAALSAGADPPCDYGCTDSKFDNYEPTATYDDGSCIMFCDSEQGLVDTVMDQICRKRTLGFTEEAKSDADCPAHCTYAILPNSGPNGDRRWGSCVYTLEDKECLVAGLQISCGCNRNSAEPCAPDPTTWPQPAINGSCAEVAPPRCCDSDASCTDGDDRWCCGANATTPFCSTNPGAT
eukprot:SAG25_NODE_404_length_8466_cov_7.291502_7_plen_998_part_01